MEGRNQTLKHFWLYYYKELKKDNKGKCVHYFDGISDAGTCTRPLFDVFNEKLGR